MNVMGFVFIGLLIYLGLTGVTSAIDRLTVVLKEDFGMPKEFETKKGEK